MLLDDSEVARVSSSLAVVQLIKPCLLSVESLLLAKIAITMIIVKAITPEITPETIFTTLDTISK